MSQIFMGCGDKTAAECYQLHLKLEEALNILGGIQQPIHANSVEEFEEQDYQNYEGRQEVLKIAEFIYESLTGVKVA
jgi:SUMO ligase MMS21 Smc5/6 complex component